MIGIGPYLTHNQTPFKDKENGSFDLTLTQYTTNATQTISISREGKIAARDAIGNFGVSPVLYLNSSVYLVDGNGSLDNPYIIAS